MVYINPHEFKGFEKEVNRIMFELKKQQISFSTNARLGTLFGCKCKDILGVYIDVSRTRYRKRKNKIIFSCFPDVRIKPVMTERGVHFHLEHLKTLKL